MYTLQYDARYIQRQISRYLNTVKHRMHAAHITVFSAQLDILHKYYAVMRFLQHRYIQKTLSDCFVQLFVCSLMMGQGAP